MDSFINLGNNIWYMSVTNLDLAFTNGCSVYFYYLGGGAGWGGQNYIRHYSGQTTSFIMFSNLSGRSFDLLITHRNFGGLNGMEIAAHPFATTSSLSASTTGAPSGSVNAASSCTVQPIHPQTFYRVLGQ